MNQRLAKWAQVIGNFGIVLSLWDFLFGTAYWPRRRPPERIGFPGMERFPAQLPWQMIWPWAPRPARPASPDDS